MSLSPVARQACQTHSQIIPTKRILITDESQMPSQYSSTPNGINVFSTTPGGTRIVYERAFLLNLRNSPMCKTPPKNIPHHLIKGEPNLPNNTHHNHQSNGFHHKSNSNYKQSLIRRASKADEDQQFDMDI